MPSKRLQPVPELSEITPAEMAARLQTLDGAVFFDSARETDGSISMLAANPRELIHGNLFNKKDFRCLREHVLRLTPPTALPDDGLPRSILGGTIDYDGTFEFAHYADILIFSHREGCWYASNHWWQDLPEARASNPDPQVARIRFTPTI